MKVVKQNVSRESLARQCARKDEVLSNGQSITKAIIMGGKDCCGSAYVERVSA